MKEEVGKLKEQAVGLEAQLKETEVELRKALSVIPNMSHPKAPVGAGDTANVTVAEFGKKPAFDFKPKDHIDLCQSLDLVDLEAGTKVAGSRFYFLKNEAAMLEIALIQYAMSTLAKAGYIPVVTPDMAKVDVLEGIGFIPRGPETQIYSIQNTDLSLVATAEITLGGAMKDQILDIKDLPIKCAGLSHCFRTEAGSGGRESRGLYRVHQFGKVELYQFTLPEASAAAHEEMLAIEEEFYGSLELPCSRASSRPSRTIWTVPAYARANVRLAWWTESWTERLTIGGRRDT